MKTIYVLTQDMYFNDYPKTFTLSVGSLGDLEYMLESIDNDEIDDCLDGRTRLIYSIQVVDQNSTSEETKIIIGATDMDGVKMDWYYDNIDKILDGKYE